MPDVCIPTWLGVLSAILVIVALVWLGHSWRRRRREQHAPRKRMPLSRGDWIGLVGLLLGIPGTLAVVAPCEDQPPAVAISLADSRLNPAEYDDPSDEYVCLVSDDEEPVSLAGWELHGPERRVNVLPRFTLEPGAAVRVHPGRGTDSTRDLYGEEGSPEWRNEGGQITLLDREGQEVDAVGYGEREQDDGSGECGPGAEAPVAP